jgi:hypothetical protein
MLTVDIRSCRLRTEPVPMVRDAGFVIAAIRFEGSL